MCCNECKRNNMRDFNSILRRANQLKILEEEETNEAIEEDEEEIGINEIHDYLLCRGRVIGFKTALYEAYRARMITEDEAYLLQKTIFAKELKEELKKTKWFGISNEEEKEIEEENEEIKDIIKFLKNKKEESNERQN